MNVILDTNILIAALKKDGITRKIILESKSRLYFPQAGIDEIYAQGSMIAAETGKNNWKRILKMILGGVNLIPDEITRNHLPEARRIMGHRDLSDSIFIAAAIALDAAIWSYDNDLKAQTRIRVLTTKDMLTLR